MPQYVYGCILKALSVHWSAAMGLISQDEAMKLIAPHARALQSIPMDAWKTYHEDLPDAMLVAFCSRTRANAIHDLMVRNAIKYCASTDGVRKFERQQMVGITIDRHIAIRLKKLDEDGRSRNQLTQQVSDYRSQLPLVGIEAVSFLELGYVLNDDETELLEVRLVHPSGDGVYWWCRLGDDGAEPGVIELFTPPNEPGPVNPAKISPKKSGEVIQLRKVDGKKDDEN